MPHQCTNCGSVFPDGSKEMLSGCPDCAGNTFQYIPEGADPADFEPESNEPPDRPIDEDSVTGKVGRAASTVREYVNARSEANASEEAARSDPSTTDDATTSRDQPAASTDEPTSPDDPATSRDQPAASTDDPATSTDESASIEDEPPTHEDRAQASARGELADLSDLSGSSPPETDGSEAASESTRERSPSVTPPREDARVVDEPDESATTDLETLRAELNDQFESIRIVEPGQYELNLMELYDREEHIIALREDGKYKIEVPDSWRDEDR